MMKIQHLLYLLNCAESDLSGLRAEFELNRPEIDQTLADLRAAIELLEYQSLDD